MFVDAARGLSPPPKKEEVKVFIVQQEDLR